MKKIEEKDTVTRNEYIIHPLKLFDLKHNTMVTTSPYASSFFIPDHILLAYLSFS